MANVKIVTDSSAQLSEEEIKDFGITVIPLTVMIDETVYVDGETITREEFVKQMITADNLPKTSQPPVGRFVDAFNDLGKDGSQVLCINMMEGLSGTVNAARQAATLSTSEVTVLDSGNTDRGLGFQVVRAGEMAKAGNTVDEILVELEKVRIHTKMYMGVMNLDNIVKGGRLHPFVGAITNLLNIKIVLSVYDGDLKVVSKVRGMKSMKKYFNNAIDDIKKNGAIQAINISYVNSTEFISEVADKVKQTFTDVPFLYRVTSPVITTHAGEGAFALFYLEDY
ncbi:DegV family protein [Lentilactobacillus kosonis]|uniref:DegV family protein n=1 Tax=Lentilactobacillus kosonis TaxID=2810561 RepID=A0A401FKX1_9LACO|nr:DegV family protein [Lentilactobacillus kosonis]GAY73030.1 hypothetical protein DUF194, DegV family [Lentilactobacillus kosonis]